MVTAAAATEHKVAPALKDVLSRAAAASQKANMSKPVCGRFRIGNIAHKALTDCMLHAASSGCSKQDEA